MEPLLKSDAADDDFGTEMQDPFIKKGKVFKSRFQIPYELIFWVVFGGLTLWCIIDRFRDNLLPMGLDFLVCR